MRTSRLCATLTIFSLLALPAQAQKGGGGTTPPPNPAIAFAGEDGLGIKVMNADGSNVRTVVSAKGNSWWTRSPCWSPDGTRLAFHGRLDGVEAIWTVKLDGTDRRSLSPTQTSVPCQTDWSPVPTPDGNHKILFSVHDWSSPAARDDIWVVNPDGSGLQNLTNTPTAYEFSAVWNRHGNALYVARDNSLVLLLVGAGPGGLVVLGETVLIAEIRAPCPGRAANTVDLVAYSSMGLIGTPVTALRAYVLDLSNLTTRLLTSKVSDERWLSFSPDDTKLAFHRSGSASTGGIFTINFDGSGEKQIQSRGVEPCWKRP